MFEEMGEMVRLPHSEWSDATAYAKLLLKARKVPGDLYFILSWFRDVGTKLEKDEKFGYKLVPVIGRGYWQSQQEYDTEKQALNKYVRELLRILREI